MVMFAHTFKSLDEVEIDNSAKFTLVKHETDGTFSVVDSNENPSLNDEIWATMQAMDSLKEYEEFCDVFNYGCYFGTAEYVDMTPNSFFSSIQVVFSEPY